MGKIGDLLGLKNVSNNIARSAAFFASRSREVTESIISNMSHSSSIRR